MRSLFGRGLRLALIGTGIAAGSMTLAAPALAAADSLPTQTRLDVRTQVVSRNGSNFTTGVFSVEVTDANGRAASGAVLIEEGDRAIGGAALDEEGKAEIHADLVEGLHNLHAVYQGDAAHAASTSAEQGVTAEATGAPDFQITVNPATLTLTQGQSGEAIVSLTPVNSSALSSPMFVTLSCSGYPDQSQCTFTPANVEIQPNAASALTSDMVLTTQQGQTSGAVRKDNGGMTLAILIPGAAGLLGLAFGARKGGWARLTLIALAALVTSLGMTACNPRYNYFNHGPIPNLPTPAGTYQMKVTAQSSNGVTATTHSADFVLTVNAVK